VRVVERPGRAEHRSRDVLARLERVVEVLDPDRSEHRVVMGRHVAGREHTGERRAERRVDRDPPDRIEASAGHQLDVRNGPDPHDHQVALDLPAGSRDDPLDALRSLEPVHGVARQDLDAVITVDGLDDPAEGRPEHAEQRRLEHLEDRHLDTERSEGGRDLGPDEPHAHDDHAPGGRGSFTDRVGVVDTPELEDAVEVRAGNVEPPVAHAGRDERRIESDAAAAGERDRPIAGVQALDRGPEQHVHVVLLPPRLRTDEQLGGRLLAPEVPLRERRALVGEIRLVADQHEPLVEPLLPQRRGGGRTAQRGADDREGAPRHGSGSGLDLDLSVKLADAEGPDGLRRRPFKGLARLHREHAAVASALDRRAVDLALRRQVAPAMCADVAERVQGTADPRDGNLVAVHLEGVRRALRHLVRRPDPHELRHRSPRSPRSVRKTTRALAEGMRRRVERPSEERGGEPAPARRRSRRASRRTP
jgi:hypothetical protein